jgi:hypothetical protein
MEFIDNIFTAQGAQRGNDIVGTNDGNFTIVGTTDMGSNGGVDILFMVINNNLNQVGSTVNIGGSVSDFAESIIAHEGDYIIAGASNSFSNDGNFDVYLLRVTKTGQVVWQETLNRADGDDFATEIVATSDGGFIITGYTEYPNNTRDLFLLKTDDMGKVVQ